MEVITTTQDGNLRVSAEESKGYSDDTEFYVDLVIESCRTITDPHAGTVHRTWYEVDRMGPVLVESEEEVFMVAEDYVAEYKK